MSYLRIILLLFIPSFFFLYGMAQPDFTADITEGCTPMHVKFTLDLTAVDMDTIERVDWYFGLGDTITGFDPDTQVYENEGLYTVAMVINGYRESAIVKTDYINVHRTLRSVFRYEEYAPGNNYRFIPLDEITDPSATYFYMWRYHKLTGVDDRSHDDIVNMSNQEIAIDSVTMDTGTYEVGLRIEDTYGCLSSYLNLVQVFENILIPNVFVPNVENFLIIDPLNQNTVLKFQVFNRYGLLVFSQESPIINWDGKSNTGLELNTGVYYYILEAVEGDPVGRYEQLGFIHLYR